jgi:hypothetical protein
MATIHDGYHELGSLQRQLDAITDQARHSPEAEALRQEYAHTFADILSREAFIEHCRREGEPVPNFKRIEGTA